MLLFAGCEKEMLQGMKDITFNATIEQPDRDSNQKIVFVNEESIYWEIGDEISIGSEQMTSGGNSKGDLVNASPGTDFENFNGVFVAALPEASSKFLGLHPYNENNVITGKADEPYFNDPTLVLSTTQPLRADTTFSRKIFPMVGWYGGSWDAAHPTPFNLDFHSLGAIVRVQIFNKTNSSATIKRIKFTSRDSRKLSGAFTVKNFNSADPHLEGGTVDTVTITCGDGATFENNSLLSFYLVLPAYKGRGDSTFYHLEMDVVTSADTHCKKNFNVGTKRCGITYMRALGITEWSETGDATPGLVGNGTAARPFKIYSLKDLQYLRDCYNSVDRKINGQPITANTHICLMRSDIILENATWTAGINNFIGNFTSRITASGERGITNNSQHPLFDTVGAQGRIDSLTVISDVALAMGTGYTNGFSPCCYHNKGVINQCNIVNATSSGMTSPYNHLAGICVTNDGTILACNNSAKMMVGSGKYVGGICLYNNTGHLVKDCQVTSEFEVVGDALVGGICYSNAGTVKDCLFGARITSSTASWGAIAYLNSASIEHCFSSHSATIVSSGTVGGIVNSLSGGTVNYCYTESQLRGKCIGGIAVSVSGGKIINCFSNHISAQIIFDASSASDYGGGLVGSLSGGDVQNSYINITSVSNVRSTGVCGGFVGKVTGGKISNCYVYERTASFRSFYGSTDNTTSTRLENCYLVAGTQTGASPIATSAFETFQGTLNTNAGTLTDAKSWTGAVNNTTPPALVAYTPAKKRR